MRKTAQKSNLISFLPEIQIEDAWAVYWLQQATWRLRREICWLWHEQGTVPDSEGKGLPPFKDRALESLEFHRFHDRKLEFFEKDPTAHYLSEKIHHCPRPSEDPVAHGSFGWLIQSLNLSEAACFTLSLGLLIYLDCTAESVIACCQNDPARTRPTLALVQKLWEDPGAVLSLCDPSHPLLRTGLIHQTFHYAHTQSLSEWERPVHVPSLIAHQLLYPDSTLTPCLEEVIPFKNECVARSHEFNIVASLLQRSKGTQVIPLMGRKGSHYRETAGAISLQSGRKIVTYQDTTMTFQDPSEFQTILTYCWLKKADLLLHAEAFSHFLSRPSQSENGPWSLPRVPVSLLLAVHNKEQLAWIPDANLMPRIRVPELTYRQRYALWKSALKNHSDRLDGILSDCARRFRYEQETICRIAEEVNGWSPAMIEEQLFAVCRQNSELDLGDLAQRITPRFDEESLILAPEQMDQFQEIVKAMTSLTKVHYQWDMAKVWNESGIAVLFSGPPGTGKTMAAEILAHQLNLPMYRIDLSQVVNKYIGETEKNLKRLFDTADTADLILFFDEADALFGRRTDVKDAHDRYANLEISYLLERMERFKGLAILATNRKKDLDRAFLRRLRYIVDFPIPAEGQRKQMWKQMLPHKVDCSDVDIDFLSTQFQLTGGHIRSVILNACLQSVNGKPRASDRFKGKLSMKALLVAVKRELEKMNQPVKLEQFERFAPLLRKEAHAEN